MAEARRRGIRLAALLATLAVAAALALGFLGRLHPALDAFSHFRLHLAALLAVCAVALMFLRYRVNALAALLLAIGSAAVTVPYLPLFGLGTADAPPPSDQPVYKLLQLNVFYGNAEPKAVLSLIARQHPDIVTLDEVTERWIPELDLIKTAYPYRLECLAAPFSTVVLSRRPMDSGHNPYCSPDGRVAIAQVDLNGRLVNVLAMHLPWPWPFDQAEMVEAHAPLLQMLGGTSIMAGDFNAVPWSATVRNVAALGGFTRVERVGPTWIGHHAMPRGLRFLGLPIDQVMSKGRIVVHSARTLDAVGSDHLPVLVEFSLEPGDEEARPTQTAYMFE